MLFVSNDRRRLLRGGRPGGAQPLAQDSRANASAGGAQHLPPVQPRA